MSYQINLSYDAVDDIVVQAIKKDIIDVVSNLRRIQAAELANVDVDVDVDDYYKRLWSSLHTVLKYYLPAEEYHAQIVKAGQAVYFP